MSSAADVIEPLALNSERLRLAADRMAHSVTNAGVGPEDPLGVMLGSFREMVLAFSAAGTGTMEEIEKSLRNTRDLSVAEVRRLAKATELAEATTAQLKAKEVTLQIEADDAVRSMLANLMPALDQSLRDVAVVRERHWNARQNWTRLLVVMGVLVVTYSVGYAAGGGHMRATRPGEIARAAIERCRVAVEAHKAEPVCSLQALLEPEG